MKMGYRKAMHGLKKFFFCSFKMFIFVKFLKYRVLILKRSLIACRSVAEIKPIEIDAFVNEKLFGLCIPAHGHYQLKVNWTCSLIAGGNTMRSLTRCKGMRARVCAKQCRRTPGIVWTTCKVLRIYSWGDNVCKQQNKIYLKKKTSVQRRQIRMFLF